MAAGAACELLAVKSVQRGLQVHAGSKMGSAALERPCAPTAMMRPRDAQKPFRAPVSCLRPLLQASSLTEACGCCCSRFLQTFPGNVHMWMQWAHCRQEVGR